MIPDQMIDTLLMVPYARGKGELSGADCWGVVELWYKYVLDIELPDRSDIPAGHSGLQTGFDVATDWEFIDKPVDHCLVVMRAHGFEAGHVGVFYQGSVIHTDDPHGCIYQPINNRIIRTRITKIAKHKKSNRLG